MIQINYIAGEGGKFGKILAHFQDLQDKGPPQGYFLEPTNIILVVAPKNVAREEDFFWGIGIKVVTWSLYLGRFVGDREAEGIWMAEKVQGWTE